MAGNKIGGQKAAEKNRALHGKDFYARIGAMGGRKGTTGGFAANRDLAREAGRKGGMISRRRKAAVKPLTLEEAAVQTDLTLAA